MEISRCSAEAVMLATAALAAPVWLLRAAWLALSRWHLYVDLRRHAPQLHVTEAFVHRNSGWPCGCARIRAPCSSSVHAQGGCRSCQATIASCGSVPNLRQYPNCHGLNTALRRSLHGLGYVWTNIVTRCNPPQSTMSNPLQSYAVHRVMQIMASKGSRISLC